MPSTDRSLLDRCIRGDSAAQFALFEQLFDLLMSVARRYESDAQYRNAIVNSAYLKILDNLSEWRTSGPFEAWCRRIVVNTALTHLRDRKVDSAREEELFADQEHHYGVSLNEAVQAMDAEQLQHLIDRLPQLTKQVFNLYVIDGLKHREIADALGMQEGTSKWHMNQARIRLQRMLGVHDGKAVNTLSHE